MFNKSIISNSLFKLTKQEKIVATYAMELGYELINLSINTIANETKTSLATVNRTFAKMGFSGFKYYKMFLFANLKSNPSTNDELTFQKTHLLLSIENTYSSLNYNQIDKVANLIIKNKKSITILCEGFCYYLGKIFAAKLNKIGFDVKIFDDNVYTGALNTNLVIIISSSMSNQSLFQKINILKKANEKVEFILLTTNSNIKDKYDYQEVLIGSYINNFRMNNQELPSDSLVLLMVIFNFIFDRIYLKNKEEYDQIIDKIKW